MMRTLRRMGAMLQHFGRKVDRYKQQDRKAKREVQDQCYVTTALSGQVL